MALQDDGIQVVTGTWALLGEDALRLRYEVFVVEQRVPEELERDDADADCLHAVAFHQAGHPIATGRLLPDGHIGRMAVSKSYRGLGVGGQVLCALVRQAEKAGMTEIVLAAQYEAQGFYARHGFQAEGKAFLDAGIQHVLMRRALRENTKGDN